MTEELARELMVSVLRERSPEGVRLTQLGGGKWALVLLPEQYWLWNDWDWMNFRKRRYLKRRRDVAQRGIMVAETPES